MTGAEMIGTAVMTDVAMDTAMTTVGATIAASVTPTGAGMTAITGMTTDVEMIGAPAMTTGADKLQLPHSANVGCMARLACGRPWPRSGGHSGGRGRDD
jgi:hypothetical protein